MLWTRTKRLPPYHILSQSGLDIGGHLRKLLGRNTNGTVQFNSGTRKQGGKQVALIAFGISQESSRVDRAASASGDDERQVSPRVIAPVFKTGAPHHDAVVEQKCPLLP